MLDYKFETTVTSKENKSPINIKELFKYKDLIVFSTKRNFTALYKQTILGPAWIVINPIITTLIFTFVFGQLAGVSTDGTPQFLFYMSGNIIWNFFLTSLNESANTLLGNAGVFGKVYFPRLTVPISRVCTTFINFLVQLFLFASFYVGFLLMGTEISPNIYILLLPVVLLQVGVLAMGMGLLISSITAKYRDLVFVFGVLTQLWMYVSPVVYPVSLFSGLGGLAIKLNPLSMPIEIFRNSLLNSGGEIDYLFWGISIIVTLIIFMFGVQRFNKVEKSFIDVV